MTKSYYKLLMVFAICLISGCQTNTTIDESSPFSSIPVGATLTLNKAITIQAEQVAVLIQHGKIVQAGQFDIFRPNCKFELFKIDEQSRTVQPDSFNITKVVDEMETVQRNEPVLLAINTHSPLYKHSLQMVLGSGESEMYNYSTAMYLSSKTDQDVYRMTCKHWESIIDDNYLSINQMREAMGEWFTLDIK